MQRRFNLSVATLKVMPGFSRILRGEDCRRILRAVRADHANQQRFGADTFIFDKRLGLMPELVAVGAEGIGKNHHLALRVRAAFRNPRRGGELLPHFAPGGNINLIIDDFLAQVIALRIIHIA
ncbi:hypothetical protein D3C76_1375220 [compost metagenome]